MRCLVKFTHGDFTLEFPDVSPRELAEFVILLREKMGLPDVSSPRRPVRSGSCAFQILSYLRENPHREFSARELIQELGFPEMNTRDSLKRLGENGALRKSLDSSRGGKRVRWSLNKPQLVSTEVA